MTLALRMGKTLQGLCAEMTADELRMWLAYDKRSPIGDARGDIHAAQIVSAVYQSQGVKLPLQEALISWNRPEEDDDAPGSLEQFFLAQE